jgi:hypothetical protein
VKRSTLASMFALFCLLIPLTVSAQDDTPEPTPTVTPQPTEPSPTLDPTPNTATPTETSTATPFGTPRPTMPSPTPTLTPRPEVEDFVNTWQEDVLYPQAVVFDLVLGVPLADVETMTITLTPATGDDPRSISFETIQTGVTAEDPFLTVNLIWPVPPADPLPFEALIQYEWSITLTDGQTATVPGVFAWANPDQRWIFLDDPAERVNLIVPADISLNQQAAITQLNQVYDLLADMTGAAPRFDLLLTDQRERLDPCLTAETITGPRTGNTATCEGAVVNAMLDDLGYEVIVLSNRAGVFPLGRAIDRMIDGFYDPIWAEIDLPQWFQYGLRALIQPVADESTLARVRDATRFNTLLTLEQMTTIPPDAPRWQDQAVVMVAYMADRFGLQAVYDLAADTTETPFDARYAFNTGGRLDALLPAMENWVFSQRAVGALTVNLYTETTATPTPTLSPTVFPPTATPTATDTPTATATPTVTGVLTATPLPSLTPTPTEEPGTPTITPLPADFEFVAPIQPTATPAPVIPADDAGDDDGFTLALIVSAGIIVLSGVIVLLIRRRRARYG